MASKYRLRLSIENALFAKMREAEEARQEHPDSEYEQGVYVGLLRAHQAVVGAIKTHREP